MKRLLLISAILAYVFMVTPVMAQQSLNDCPWATQDFPFVTEDSYMKYSWSSGLYMPTQLGGAQTMTKFSLRVNNTTYSGSFSYSNVHVYVRHTSLNEFPNSSHPFPSTDTYTGFTKVYEGTLSFNGTGIYTFNFGGSGASSSFNYNGIDNLEVLIENRGGNQPWQAPWFTRADPGMTNIKIGKRGGGDWGWSSAKTNFLSSFEYNVALVFNSTSASPCYFPLPVELTNSNLSCNSKEVEITWSTASETNNDYFQIEYSKDGTSWERVAKVNGSGNTSDSQDYKVRLENNNPGISYYRLSQTDYDGTTEMLNTFSADCSDKKEFLVYPNVASDYVNIQTPENITNGELQLVSTIGQLQTLDFDQTSLNGGRLNLTDLKGGVYFLRFVDKGGKTWVKKLMVE